MCNLYSQKNSLQEVRDWFRVDVVDASAGNLPPLNSIFPGYDAPVIYRKKSERIYKFLNEKSELICTLKEVFLEMSFMNQITEKITNEKIINTGWKLN